MGSRPQQRPNLLLEEEGEAHRKARQEGALAARFAERDKRQREDRGNTRAWQALQACAAGGREFTFLPGRYASACA